MNHPEIIYLEETASTLSYIKALQEKRLLDNFFTVYTDFQTAGRGQKNNSWESARGENLLFSTILFPKMIRANQQFILSQIVSLAIVDVLSFEATDICIKWPNDIYWKNKKMGGILIENNLLGESINQSVLGVGINLNQVQFESDAPNPVSLKQITGKSYDCKNVLDDILTQIQYYYSQLNSESEIEKIKSAYKQKLFRKEGLHLFADNNISFEATIEDVEDSGLLVLKTKSGNIQKYAFKEISYIL